MHTLLAAACVCEEQQQFLRGLAIDRAVRLVDQHLPIIATLAKRLSDARKLERDEIMATVRSAPGGHKLLGEPEPRREPEMRYQSGLLTRTAECAIGSAP